MSRRPRKYKYGVRVVQVIERDDGSKIWGLKPSRPKPRVGWEARHPQHVSQLKNGFIVWQDFERRWVAVQCLTCGLMCSEWITDRTRTFVRPGNGIGSFVRDELSRKDQETIAYLTLLVDWHRDETGHDVGLTHGGPP